MAYLTAAAGLTFAVVLAASVAFYYRHDPHADRWMPRLRGMMLGWVAIIALLLILWVLHPD